MADWEDDTDDNDGGQTGIATETKKKVQKPPRFKVLLHNDDFTSMEFVIMILKEVFHKTDMDAFKIMMAVHQAGVGVAGVYSYEIAEAKVSKATELARANEYPLLCTLEEE
jgi:ATP-dependent Clp protease adaptor protein ClpS